LPSVGIFSDIFENQSDNFIVDLLFLTDHTDR